MKKRIKGIHISDLLSSKGTKIQTNFPVHRPRLARIPRSAICGRTAPDYAKHYFRSSAPALIRGFYKRKGDRKGAGAPRESRGTRAERDELPPTACVYMVKRRNTSDVHCFSGTSWSGGRRCLDWSAVATDKEVGYWTTTELGGVQLEDEKGSKKVISKDYTQHSLERYLIVAEY